MLRISLSDIYVFIRTFIYNSLESPYQIYYFFKSLTLGMGIVPLFLRFRGFIRTHS
jgi:hypothetical protein